MQSTKRRINWDINQFWLRLAQLFDIKLFSKFTARFKIGKSNVFPFSLNISLIGAIMYAYIAFGSPTLSRSNSAIHLLSRSNSAVHLSPSQIVHLMSRSNSAVSLCIENDAVSMSPFSNCFPSPLSSWKFWLFILGLLDFRRFSFYL